VGIRTTTWRWQYRLQPTDPWTDLRQATTKIYTVLEVPKSPWQQTPYQNTNTQLPWTEVLDYACRWAFLAATLDDAAARVTRNVYDLGPTVVEYDCPGGGSTRYAWPNFNCTAFLERIHGGIGNGHTSTALTVRRLFLPSPTLWLRPLAIAHATASGRRCLVLCSQPTPCNWLQHLADRLWLGGFSYHEVAWTGACTSNEEVFDACLQVDGDADPTTAPHTPLLPINCASATRATGNIVIDWQHSPGARTASRNRVRASAG